MNIFKFASLALAFSLAGCAAPPKSYIEGRPLAQADFNLYPVRVVAIDGELYFDRPSASLSVAPGVHSIVLAIAPGQGARGSTQKTFAFKVLPCTRYNLAGRRENAMSADWALVVDRMDPVSPCNPEEELKNFASEPAVLPRSSGENK
jgi:hypothetical protein